MGPGNFVRRREPAPGRQNFGPTDQFGNPVVGAPNAERPIVSYMPQPYSPPVMPPPPPPGSGGGFTDWLTEILTRIGGGSPERWAMLPRTAGYAELMQASGLPAGSVFGQLSVAIKGANWVVQRGEEAPGVPAWDLAIHLRPDVSIPNRAVFRTLTETTMQLTPPQTPGGPMMPVPGAGPLAVCGGTPPMQTVRRTCGPGLILAYDGMCYPKRLLPAALRMNKSKKAKVTNRDWASLRQGEARAERVVENGWTQSIREALPESGRPRRRRRTTTTRKK